MCSDWLYSAVGEGVMWMVYYDLLLGWLNIYISKSIIFLPLFTFLDTFFSVLIEPQGVARKHLKPIKVFPQNIVSYVNIIFSVLLIYLISLLLHCLFFFFFVKYPNASRRKV